jgi:hypothetical protein
VDAHTVGRLLILVGAVVLLLGVVLAVFGRIPLLGRLPGDLVFHRDGLTVYIPLATMLLLSVALTVLLTIVSRLLR